MLEDFKGRGYVDLKERTSQAEIGARIVSR